ncbi:MAG: Rpn family recombination-promoting nuclease/putative transposase [Clostridia bacterium]|nr:Rpn family recombination-promoting nuclease/putative transposase [Clostridia bacterium]
MNNETEIPEYMYPKNDFIFKRLFGYEGNEEITKDLVSNIIGEKIKTLQFKNPYLLRETKEDKEEILDIKASLDNNIQCDIEIQVGNNHDEIKRILNSWAKMYRQSIGKSKEYKNMKRTIVIFITMFDIDSLREIEQYKTKWKIQEEKLKIKLTDVFEIDIIELSKAKRQLKKGTFEEPKNLKEWVTFLINPKELEESKMEEMSEEVRKAYELWQSLNLNEEEREIAEQRFMDLASAESAKEYEKKLGRKEGRVEGRAEGRVEGRAEKQKEIAKKLLEMGLEIEKIIEATGLAKEEIENL